MITAGKVIATTSTMRFLMATKKSLMRMVTLWILRIQFTKQSSFIAINKFSKPYRSTEKRKRYGDYQTTEEERETCCRGKEAPVRHP